MFVLCPFFTWWKLWPIDVNTWSVCHVMLGLTGSDVTSLWSSALFEICSCQVSCVICWVSWSSVCRLISSWWSRKVYVNCSFKSVSKTQRFWHFVFLKWKKTNKNTEKDTFMGQINTHRECVIMWYLVRLTSSVWWHHQYSDVKSFILNFL